eukprot:gnl/TRDRNA2_/TRDRNA2_144334_c0_seq1.p1 gnl/TRDRNA2_/TRDRNA2_144334_c0~~gnl/TRDRNA2_/TRDRNA2_144334_c0_seq1.p1  ORF type:complete len:141 (-),score=29.59 gnl/TRDRNA2_/TRDRNA2_144334_c0_seq1:114-494(-)
MSALDQKDERRFTNANLTVIRREFLMKEMLRCVKPEEFLSEGLVGPTDVDALIVQAGGDDPQVVSDFFALPGFAPTVVVFDGLAGLRGSWQTTAPLIEWLAVKGYDVYQDVNRFVAFMSDSIVALV